MRATATGTVDFTGLKVEANAVIGQPGNYYRSPGFKGGAWRFAMVAQGDFEVGFHGEYREIVPNERIVSTEVFEGVPGVPGGESLNTLTLTEADGRTTLEVLVEHPDRESRDAHINSGMEGGMQEAMDLLEQVAVSLR